MDIEFLSKNVKKIESVFLNILYLKPEERVIAPDMNVLGDLKNAINSIFEDNKCINVIYTLNTDKPFFGIKINPNMSPADATIILSSDERVKLNKYQIEFDSKLFEVGLSDTELAALTIYEISSMMDNFELFDNIRALIDTNIVTNDDVVNIRDSVNYAQLIIFALKDTMYKLSSFIFKDDKDELTANVIKLSKDIKLGVEKTAENSGIFTIDDIEIISDAQHPLIAVTGSLRDKNTTIK